MIVHFVDMALIVLPGSIVVVPSPLFPTPRNEPESALWPESILFDQPKGLEDSEEASTIVVGPCLRSSIPRVDVPTHKQDLVWLLRPYDFEYQIGRVAAVLEV